MRNTDPVLYMAPLVQVAWADGHVSDGERLSILEAAAARIVNVDDIGDFDGAAYDQLLQLLSHRPPKEFFASGLAALRSSLEALPFKEALSLRRDLLASCARIAAASRSAIGLGIPENERRTIAQINAELSGPAPSPSSFV